jgi:hypothetical protein
MRKARVCYKSMAGTIYEGNLEPAENARNEAKDFLLTLQSF